MRTLTLRHIRSVERGQARKWYRRERDRHKARHILFSWDECEEPYPEAKIRHRSWDCESGETVKEMFERFRIEDTLGEWCRELSWEEICRKAALHNAGLKDPSEKLKEAT